MAGARTRFLDRRHAAARPAPLQRSASAPGSEAEPAGVSTAAGAHRQQCTQVFGPSCAGVVTHLLVHGLLVHGGDGSLQGRELATDSRRAVERGVLVLGPATPGASVGAPALDVLPHARKVQQPVL